MSELICDRCGQPVLECRCPGVPSPEQLSTPAAADTSAAGEWTTRRASIMFEDGYDVLDENGAVICNVIMHIAEKIVAAHRASLAALREQLEQAKEDQRLFGEVMALMNGDGGHYRAEHGSMAAFDRAVARWEERYRRMDSQEASRERA